MKNQICTGGCKYCAITEVFNRANEWEKLFEAHNGVIGINKSTTIFNPPPLYMLDNKASQKSFYDFPVKLFKNDFVGFCAISDPMLPQYRDYLNYFLDTIPKVAKVVSFVTKFPIGKKLMKRLAEIPNFQLFISTTGLDSIEVTTTASRVKTLALAKEYGVKALPVIHPYISGMTNLSFVKDMVEIGYIEMSLKGLRYDKSMSEWMPKKVSELYEGTDGSETLISDNHENIISGYGGELISLREWSIANAVEPEGSISFYESKKMVEELLLYANVTSSDTNNSVKETAIKRRL